MLFAMQKTDFLFFLLSTVFFLFCFLHITQHNIQNITKQNNRHILNIPRSNQKGGREGRTIKTQKSLLYTITYIHQKTLASINGRGPPTRAVVHSHDTICRRLRIQYVFLHMCGVNQFWIIVYKLGLTDQSIRSNDDKTRFTCVHRLMTTGHSQNICRKVPDDVVLHIWQFKFDCSFILNLL